MITAKPYRLIPKIQNYDWGTKNKNAFIPKLLGIKAEQNVPYAELWIGAHPKSPSEIIIENSKYELNKIIEEFPIEILGKEISKKFKKKLPFLLKILSIDNALSIQAHPNKSTAKILHKNDPINYPDDNHKPEIAIAIDKLNAIVGLKNIKQIKKCFDEYPVLYELLNQKLVKKINSNDLSIKLDKEIYKQIMSSEPSILKNVIEGLINTITAKKSKSKSEIKFLSEFDNYGIDVGLISLLLFNFIDLGKDEAIFTPAGIPHAYLSGNIIECMANSDNVVRAGLTNKFKDNETLLKILDTDLSKTKVKIVHKKNITLYKTSADEFEIKRVTLNSEFKSYSSKNNLPEICLVLEGKIIVKFLDKWMEFKKGESFLKPSILDKYTIVSKLKECTFISASIP